MMWRKIFPMAFYLLARSLDVGCACERNSHDVAACVHVYLERDFSAIESIVYQEKFKSDDPWDQPDTGPLLLDGPELENNCLRARGVVDCFQDLLLSKCKSLPAYHQFNHHVLSFMDIYNWLCGNTDLMRHRFRLLLLRLECFEKVRSRVSKCHQPEITPNIWTRIVRYELQPEEICRPLELQTECLIKTQFIRHCGEDGAALYKNLTQVFFQTWCSKSATIHSPRTVVILFSILIPLLLTTTRSFSSP